MQQLHVFNNFLAELGTVRIPGLLSVAAAVQADAGELDEDALLAELGIGDESADEGNITMLRHVRSSVEKRAAEEIADRTPCADFDKFQALFEQVERELKGAFA